MTEEAEIIVTDALVKARIMRDAQKYYFASRTQESLMCAKKAERCFDEALEDAEYAMKHGVAKPKQGELPL